MGEYQTTTCFRYSSGKLGFDVLDGILTYDEALEIVFDDYVYYKDKNIPVYKQLIHEVDSNGNKRLVKEIERDAFYFFK